MSAVALKHNQYNCKYSAMVISGLSPTGQDSNADRYLRFSIINRACCTWYSSHSTHYGIHGIWRRRRGIVRLELFPMNSSIIRTAFENVATHISNLEVMKNLVDSLESETLSPAELIERLQEEIENAEVTLRTDIRILINECRHLESRMSR